MAQPLAIALCGKMLGPWLGEQDFRKWEEKKKKEGKKGTRQREREGENVGQSGSGWRLAGR